VVKGKLQHKKFCKRCGEYKPHLASKSTVCVDCVEKSIRDRVGKEQGKLKLPKAAMLERLEVLRKKLKVKKKT